MQVQHAPNRRSPLSQQRTKILRVLYDAVPVTLGWTGMRHIGARIVLCGTHLEDLIRVPYWEPVVKFINGIHEIRTPAD